MNKLLSLTCLFLLLVSAPLRADWQRPIANYTRHAYKAGTQNWDIQQHDNGWIYVANNKGLLEFDGVEWNTYPIRNAKTRALKMGNDGRIYIGGMEQFGYFSPNSLGGLDYTCLSDSLLPGTSVGIIWNILMDKGRVYFQSDRHFFYYENGKVGMINASSEIYSSQIVRNNLYAITAGGLMMLNETELVPVCDTGGVGGVLKTGGLLSYQGKLLIVSRNRGFFSYDGFALRKYATAADDFCSRNQLFCAALKDSLLALGSIQNGVCLLNLNTGEVENISTEHGLQNKTALSMTFDTTGNLWVGLDNGIDCIHLKARIASLYGGKSVIGSGYASCCYQGNFYLGTNQGLYRTALPTRLNKKEPMDFMPGTGGQIWSLYEYDDKLFCCSDNGIFILDGGRMEHLAAIRGVWGVTPMNGRKDVLIAGTYSGLYLLGKRGARWEVEGKIKGSHRSSKDVLVEDGTNALWVANKEDGISRLLLSDDLREVKKEKYYNGKELPRGYDACLAQIDNEVTVTSHDGLWRYDRTDDRLERFPSLENQMDGRTVYTYLSVDSLKNIWYVADGALKVLRYDAAERKYYRQENEIFLRGSLIENFENIHLCDEGRIVAGTEEGFSLIRLEPQPVHPVPLNLQIRKVYMTGQRDSLIYGRSYLYDEVPVVVPYAYNSLRIEYSVNDYNRMHTVLYSYKLSRDGEEGKWSEYGENQTKEFTGLHEGRYVFSVKLLTDRDVPPVVTSFAFEVLPPWYRSWWGYLIYTVVLGLVLYYTYYRIADGRKRLLMQKELELYRQKQEFQKESDLKDRKIDSLKEENLRAELGHKSEELIRTTLNIVRKNEMLMDIRKEVLGISHSINEENLVSLRRKTFRLLGQIETNIEHDDDLQTFQSVFDSVHHDFFRKLEEAYPDLNNKDKMLCAYIKMSLLSKEIAPLLNISLRGVEISRYRLRKKLNLSEGENLAEFLQKFSK